MASRRRFSYQWQLFIPLIIVLWAVIFGMAFWQFYNEREFRKEQIVRQLDLVNARVIDLYEKKYDWEPFLNFVTRYYRDLPVYDVLRMTVYDDRGHMLKCYGEPIDINLGETMKQGITKRTDGDGDSQFVPEDKYFYFMQQQSSDGKIRVFTLLPFGQDLLPSAPSTRFILILIGIALVTTVFAYFSTRYFGRNITILRSVAERAAKDPSFIPAMDYPPDELGDISRQIIHLYNTRIEAMQQQKREHDIAMHAIEEKARAKRQLTNNINHELRTPIGVIKGYLDTIVENPDMDEGSRTHFMRKAQEHVNRLVNLISDVSAITRLEEGGELIATEEVDYHDLIYTVSSDLEEAGALGDMRFHFDLPLDCKVNGNYNLLSGMIINLAKNAVAYSKGTVCEVVCVAEDEKSYTFEFRDNGRGVGEEHIPHLFERFYRIDSGRSRRAGGTGLGLPIVQKTIMAHGGEIEVMNRPTGGLSFRYTLIKYRERRTVVPS